MYNIILVNEHFLRSKVPLPRSAIDAGHGYACLPAHNLQQMAKVGPSKAKIKKILKFLEYRLHEHVFWADTCSCSAKY